MTATATSVAYSLNAAGQVAGERNTLQRHGDESGSIGLGCTTAPSTVNIGLTGTEYTRNDGYRFSDTDPSAPPARCSGVQHAYNGTGTRLRWNRLAVPTAPAR